MSEPGDCNLSPAASFDRTKGKIWLSILDENFNGPVAYMTSDEAWELIDALSDAIKHMRDYEQSKISQLRLTP